MDELTSTGSKIDQRLLDELKLIIEERSDVVVEHRFYRAGRSAYKFVASDYAELEEYLKTRVRFGDSFYFWLFDDCCTESNAFHRARVPDAEGRVPIGGAY